MCGPARTQETLQNCQQGPLNPFARVLPVGRSVAEDHLLEVVLREERVRRPLGGAEPLRFDGAAISNCF